MKGVKVVFPISITVGNSAVLRAVEANPFFPATSLSGERVRAVWIENEIETDLGSVVSLSASVSYFGTQCALTLPWPNEKNPRGAGEWQNLLIPSDGVRIKISQVVETGSAGLAIEIPLVMGVPLPDGIGEVYGRSSELIEIKIGDVTGAASRITEYMYPSRVTEKGNAKLVAETVLDPIEVKCFYETVDVDLCVEIFPNALMVADEALIKEQDYRQPLTGVRRIRYGDRNGVIVYMIAADLLPGSGFVSRSPGADYDFEIPGDGIVSGFKVGTESIVLRLARINPYIELGSRLKIKTAHAGIDEIVEVAKIGYRIIPGDERMFVNCIRQFTL
jgi:hypothetical protein